MSKITKKGLLRDFQRSMDAGSAALFIGAGMSRAAGYVDWQELLREIADDLGLDVERETDLIALAQYHKNARKSRAAINTRLITEFSKEAEATENHELIAQLPISPVVLTEPTWPNPPKGTRDGNQPLRDTTGACSFRFIRLHFVLALIATCAGCSETVSDGTVTMRCSDRTLSTTTWQVTQVSFPNDGADCDVTKDGRTDGTGLSPMTGQLTKWINESIGNDLTWKITPSIDDPADLARITVMRKKDTLGSGQQRTLRSCVAQDAASGTTLRPFLLEDDQTAIALPLADPLTDEAIGARIASIGLVTLVQDKVLTATACSCLRLAGASDDASVEPSAYGNTGWELPAERLTASLCQRAAPGLYQALVRVQFTAQPE